MNRSHTESAFPVTPPLEPSGGSAGGYPYPERGLTKRELFAAMAMQGLLSSGRGGLPQDISNESVRCANALLYALSDEQVTK